ncbi:hypothetical protein ACFXAZ_19740 [Streptomyces sp. NPDC059477]|uniref:hypothetical protein n=1 Tax=Streptomyces sp. NPDC059477 TaxID=3346847 RepID=UPI00367FB067
MTPRAAGPGAPGAPTVPDAVDALAGRELRPGTGVTPLRNGIHLRGWRSNVTLEGSSALPALWRILEEALRTGGQAALSESAPAGSPLRRALCTLIAQLDAHDLLVDRPGDPDGTAPATSSTDRAASTGSAGSPWLRAVADLPGAAAGAIAAARPQVLAAAPVGPLAQAAGRALARGGASPSYEADTTGYGGQIIVTASGGRLAVAAGILGGTGFVTPPGSPEQVRADAAALTARLGPDPDGRTAPRGPGATGATEAAGVSARPGTTTVKTSAALVPLVAGAAVHRLLCAVAGLPDPASEGDDQRILPDRPSVLVAEARPLRAAYHSWLGADQLDPDRAAAMSPPRTLAEALRRVAALGDERVGVLAPPLPGTLPQLPVALVSCRVAGATLLAGAPRADLARLDAICRAAELRLGAPGPGVVVGMDPGHAWGRALRRAVVHTPRDSAAGLGEEHWSHHPQARHWWATLTGRLGIRATLSVFRLSAASVFHAVVRHGPAPGLPDRTLGTAVEATPGDAVAFAALAATARVLAAAQQVTYAHESRPSGAAAPIAAAGVRLAGWEDESWTTGWLAGLAAREPALHTALRRLTGLRAEPWEPAGEDARAVAAGLRGCGFTVLNTIGGA